MRAAAVGLALLVAGLAAGWWWSAPATPDAFYSVPRNLPRKPGTLLKTEAFTRAVPSGARAWRILYSTTRANGGPSVASAIVMISTTAPEAPRPVVAWAHGTTGIEPGCAPSLLSNPFSNVPALNELLAAGWVYVATDYAGLGTKGGHAYLIGEDAAHAVLDSVRAARRIRGLSLQNRTIVWGHSQGGNSALWAGMRAHDYAPDINVVGVAALAPASDLPALVLSAQTSTFGKIVAAYLTIAYGDAYADSGARSYLHQDARPIVDDMASRCATGFQTLFSALEAHLLPRDGVFARSPDEGGFGARLKENTPRNPIAAPLLIAQGERDDLVLPEIQDRYVAARCAAGQEVEYRIYRGRDHLSLIAADSRLTADLISWTRDRLSGSPVQTSCPHS